MINVFKLIYNILTFQFIEIKKVGVKLNEKEENKLKKIQIDTEDFIKLMAKNGKYLIYLVNAIDGEVYTKIITEDFPINSFNKTLLKLEEFCDKETLGNMSINLIDFDIEESSEGLE